MKAITVVPGTTNLRLVERPEPSISAPDKVKLRVLRVGICGTDREEAAGGRSLAPNGVYVLTGIPGGNRPLEIPGAELMRQLVLDKQMKSSRSSNGHDPTGEHDG